MLYTRSDASRIVRAAASALPAISSTRSRSPPAENALPAPVTTATRVSGSASTVSQTWVSSQCRRAFVAFRTSGRLIVMRSTPFGFRSKTRCR